MGLATSLANEIKSDKETASTVSPKLIHTSAVEHRELNAKDKEL
jgi:hypothetical protein